MDLQTKLRFLSLYRMVLADGIICPEEMLKLYKLGQEKFGLTEEAVNSLIMDDEDTMPVGISDTQKISLLYEMAQIAWSDNELCQAEKDLLHSYAQHFGITDDAIRPTIDFLLDCAEKGLTEEEVINHFS